MRDVYHADISHYTVRVYSTEPPEDLARARSFFVYKEFSPYKEHKRSGKISTPKITHNT